MDYGRLRSGFFRLARLEGFVMTWQFVAVVFLFLTSAVVLGVTGHDTMATFALGAAAGVVGQPLVSRPIGQLPPV